MFCKACRRLSVISFPISSSIICLLENTLTAPNTAIPRISTGSIALNIFVLIFFPFFFLAIKIYPPPSLNCNFVLIVSTFRQFSNKNEGFCVNFRKLFTNYSLIFRNFLNICVVFCHFVRIFQCCFKSHVFFAIV